MNPRRVYIVFSADLNSADGTTDVVAVFRSSKSAEAEAERLNGKPGDLLYFVEPYDLQ